MMTLLIHLAEGCSLRETAVRASEGGVASVSDVAIMKRLKASEEWLRWLALKLAEPYSPSKIPDGRGKLRVSSLWFGKRGQLVPTPAPVGRGHKDPIARLYL